MSGRAIEKKYRVGRRTIVRALASAWPEPRKQLPARASKLDPFKPVIDEILKADLDAPPKQRHAVTRIWHRLMDEHEMSDVSYPWAGPTPTSASRRSGSRPAGRKAPPRHTFRNQRGAGASPNDECGIWGSDLRAELILSGNDTDWPLVNRVWAVLVTLWSAIAWDEMSGFEVNKDAPGPA